MNTNFPTIFKFSIIILIVGSFCSNLNATELNIGFNLTRSMTKLNTTSWMRRHVDNTYKTELKPGFGVGIFGDISIHKINHRLGLNYKLKRVNTTSRVKYFTDEKLSCDTHYLGALLLIKRNFKGNENGYYVYGLSLNYLMAVTNAEFTIPQYVDDDNKNNSNYVEKIFYPLTVGISAGFGFKVAKVNAYRIDAEFGLDYDITATTGYKLKSRNYDDRRILELSLSLKFMKESR